MVKIDDTLPKLFFSQLSVPQSRHMFTQTQTNTHTQTHTYQHTCMNKDIQKHTYIHVHTYTHKHTDIDTHINIYRQTHTRTHTHTVTHADRHRCIYLFTISEFNTKQYLYWLLKMLLLCRYVIIECVHGLRSNE